MTGRWGWVILGAVLLDVALLAQAPAWLLADALKRYSGGQLALEAAQGTVWSGQGRLLWQAQAPPLVLVQNLGWRVSPLTFLTARLQLALEFDGKPSGELSVGKQAIEVRNLRAALPAQVLGALPQLAQTRPTGKILVDIPALAWANQGSSGAGQVFWREASLQLPGQATRWTGELGVEISAQDNRLTLTTLPGAPLPLRLELLLRPEGISTRLAAPER